MKRAVIFAHYDKDGIVAPYAAYYLHALKGLCDHLVCVSTASLPEDEIRKLSVHCDKVIVRENEGYDFMSYKAGLESFDHHDYDEVLFCNDSVYGPLFDLAPIFEKMDKERCDFWGMTQSDEIAYHLQSYFMLFKRSALHSDAFDTFWNKVETLRHKEEIIQRYEVGLTSSLQKAGLTASAYATPQPNLRQKIILAGRKLTPKRIFRKLFSLLQGKSALPSLHRINITLTLWEELICKSGMPFIKVSLLRDNPNRVPVDHIYDLISAVCDYDISLIREHQERIKPRMDI
jgi:rhamnosyltransferase